MEYQFSSCSDEKTSQKELYDKIALPLLKDCFNGVVSKKNRKRKKKKKKKRKEKRKRKKKKEKEKEKKKSVINKWTDYQNEFNRIYYLQHTVTLGLEKLTLLREIAKNQAFSQGFSIRYLKVLKERKQS